VFSICFLVTDQSDEKNIICKSLFCNIYVDYQTNLHVPFDVSNLGPSLHLHSQVEDGALGLDRNLHGLPIYEESK
jgi:hypothetical protein